MNRVDLQQLADERVADAAALLQAQRWSAAYYLLGYAVECAIKVCATRLFHEHEVPEKKLVENFYTHNFNKLIEIAGIKPALDARTANDPVFQKHWETANTWNETSRYDPYTPEAVAKNMQTAVTDPVSGVLPWLKTLW